MVNPIVARPKKTITHIVAIMVFEPTGTENNPTLEKDMTNAPINIQGARRPQRL